MLSPTSGHTHATQVRAKCYASPGSLDQLQLSHTTTNVRSPSRTDPNKNVILVLIIPVLFCITAIRVKDMLRLAMCQSVTLGVAPSVRPAVTLLLLLDMIFFSILWRRI